MSLVDSGKCDAALTAARQVFGDDDCGVRCALRRTDGGCSVYGLKGRLKRLPELLRHVADEIESSLRREDERHE